MLFNILNRIGILVACLPSFLWSVGPVWTQTDWSGGNGQDAWSNQTMYQSDDGHVNMDNPIGEVSIKVDLQLGDGSDGEKIVTLSNTVVNTYTYITSPTTHGGQNIITVNSTIGLSVGDEIFIHQSQHATNAGSFEYRIIQSIEGLNISLDSNLTNTYYSGVFDAQGASVTQIVRVPHYTKVTINNGCSIIARSWDGYCGGIVVFRAIDSIICNGTGQISVDAAGFRGGGCGACGNSDWGQNGESVLGLGSGGGTTQPTNWPNPEPLSNGGVGAYGPSGYGGEPAGGGGYGVVGSAGSAYAYSSVAQGGNSVGSTDLSVILFGGAGGGGGDDDGQTTNGSIGGNGAGAIIIEAKVLYNINATANGEGGTNGGGTASGTGGGGAGGALFFCAKAIHLGIVTATGGPGGDKSGVSNANDISGSGGSGRIRLDYQTISGTTSPTHGHAETVQDYDSGYVISSVYSTDNLSNPSVNGPYMVHVTSTLNGGSVLVSLRTAATAEAIASATWVSITNTLKITPSSGIGYNEKYIQYKTILKKGTLSPQLKDLTIEFNEPPSSVTLSLPVNGSEVPQTPLLDWSEAVDNNTNDVVTYIVEIDDASDFNSINVRKTGVTQSQYQVLSADALSDNTQYFWRVYAKDSYPDSTICATAFTMFIDEGNNVPSLSYPLFPPNNTERALSDSLTWTRNDADPGDTLGYTIRISLDEFFFNIVASKANWSGVSIALQDIDNIGNLSDDHIYYWQVEAHDPSGASSGYTQGAQHFCLNINNDIPTMPYDLYPYTQTVLAPTDYLRWKAEDGDSVGLEPDVLIYTIVIDDNLDFLSPLSLTTGITTDSIRFTSLINAAFFVDNTQYYWKIYATDNHGAQSPMTNGSHNFWYNSTNDTPSEPTNLLPITGSQIQPTSSLSWSASVDGDPYDTTTYCVQVSEQSDFSILSCWDTTKQLSIVVNTLSGFASLITSKTYYVRVQGFDNQQAASNWAGGSSYSLQFLSTSPTIPVSIAPLGDRAYFPTEPIYWHHSDDIDAGDQDYLLYILQISKSTDFTLPLVSDTAGDTSRILAHLPGYSQFIDDSRYFWRIGGRDNHTASSGWSDTNSFILDKSNKAPSTPQPIFPLDSEAVALPDYFTWHRAIDPDPNNTVTYTILSATDSGFTDTVLLVPGITDTTSTLGSIIAANQIEKPDTSQNPIIDTAGLLDNRFYYWKVAALDNRNASSPFSLASYIFSNTVNDTPGVPYALQPNFNAITFPTQYLSWKAFVTEEFGDTTSYIVQVSADSLFIGSLLSVDTLKEVNRIQLMQLSGYQNFSDETYLYWRLRSQDISGNTAGFSNHARFLFSVSNLAPTIPNGLYPSDSVAVVNPSDSIYWNSAIEPDNDSIYYDLWIADSPFDGSGDTNMIDGKSNSIVSTRKVLNTIESGYETLQSNRVYFWRLRARDEHYFYSSWSPLGMFRFNSTIPPIPSGLFPPDNTEIISDDYLSWLRVIDVDTGIRDTLCYVVLTDDDADFSSPISLDTVQQDTTLFLRNMHGVNNLNDDVYYYWKVKALDVHNSCSEYSTRGVFFFNRFNTPPDTPHTLLPPVFSSVRPFQTLTWTATDPDLADTLSFVIEISKDSLFTQPLVSKNNWAKPSIRLMDFRNYKQVFTHDSSYYWRVRTLDSKKALSAYSSFSSFIFDKEDDIASAPTIVAPAIRSYTVGTTNIIWKNSSDADDTLIMYHVDIAKDSGFTDIIAYSERIPQGTDTVKNITLTPLSSLRQYSGLIKNTFYYLRVYPVSFVDTIWTPGNTSERWEIWYGDSTQAGNSTISLVTVVTPCAKSPLGNIAHSVDSLVKIVFPDSVVSYPVGVVITRIPVLVNATPRIHTSGIEIIPMDTMLTRLQNSARRANKYATGDERTHFVKEGIYSIRLFPIKNPDSSVSLLDSVALEISYNDTNNNKMIDGEERIPVDALTMYRLNEASLRWEQTSAAIQQSNKRAARRIGHMYALKQRLPGENSHILITDHFSVYTLLAFADMATAFDNFKVYPNPIRLKSLQIPTATISYWLRDSAEVKIRVYSETGGLVWEKKILPGQYGGIPSRESATLIPWDIRNSYGRLVANGMYVIKIQVKPTTGGVFLRKQYIGVIK